MIELPTAGKWWGNIMKYKVIPAPEAIHAGGGGKALQKAAQAYEQIINNEAAQGWIFHAMDSTTVTQKCCLCIPTAPVQVKILVFRRTDAAG